MQPDENPKKPQTLTLTEILHRIWNALRRRPLQKLAAVVLAVLFWAIVIGSDPNLPIERTILNAPVTVSASGLEALRGRGLTVMDDLSAGTITVKLRVQVTSANYDRATAETFTPRLDLSSQITQAGENQQVFFSVPNTIYGEVLSIEPDHVTVTVEPYIQKSRVPVVIERTGEATESLWVESQTADPSQVLVSGPESLVNRVQRAVVNLPLESLSVNRQTDSLSSLVTLQDKDGNTVSSPQLRITSDGINIDSVRIDATVYPMRSVPVHVESAVSGSPAHGYTLSGTRITPDEVAVAASQDVLDEIDAVYVTTPVDISGKSETVTASSALRAIGGTVRLSTGEVLIEADIEPATHTHTYNDLPVLVMGVGANLTATVSPPRMDAIFRGDYDQVQGLTADDITLYVDAGGLGAGTHTLDVQCAVNGTESFTFQPERPQVTLTIAESQ